MKRVIFTAAAAVWSLALAGCVDEYQAQFRQDAAAAYDFGISDTTDAFTGVRTVRMDSKGNRHWDADGNRIYDRFESDLWISGKDRKSLTAMLSISSVSTVRDARYAALSACRTIAFLASGRVIELPVDFDVEQIRTMDQIQGRVSGPTYTFHLTAFPPLGTLSDILSTDRVTFRTCLGDGSFHPNELAAMRQVYNRALDGG